MFSSTPRKGRKLKQRQLILIWSNVDELHNMIESVLNGIVADCSLLIVCLMSHGSRGVITGSNGKAIPVNKILNAFVGNLMPKELPLVRKL